MANQRPTESADDLSALSWVQDELRRALELSNKSLRRYLKEAENASDVDIVDPSVLRTARNQLHQSVGVLELVGLGAPAALLRAAEAALQKLSARPRLITLQAVHTLEHGSFAVLEFIARKLAGKPVAVLALFPQYRALQELAGAPRVHPADLWPVPWAWHSLPADPTASPRHADAAVIARIETDLLALMRSPVPATAARMSELFAALGAGASGRLATLWQLAAAFFEAQSDGLVTPDVYNKRIGSRLLSQLRAGDGSEPSERLAHDLLFFCSQARRAPGRGLGPRLQAVHAAWALPVEAPVDLDVPQLGRFDPAWVAQARKRISSAKEVWSAVAGGDVDRLGTLAEQFSLVADSLQRLYTEGAVLGRALQAAAAHAVALGTEPPAELAMEVATALLYLDASVDDGEFDHPDTAQRIQRLAQRIDFVRQGREPGPLELWMEDLYRRVSDRQTMGSVVQELRASLSEVEKHIDQYFRNPAQREVLIPVPAQLSAMRGVLSVLGLDQASAAVLRMRDDVDALANTEVDPQQAIAAGTFDRLADNLGALSFLIDMVSVQPQMAKSLFRFDPAQGLLSAVVAREDRPTGFDALDTGTVVGARDTDALAVTLEFDRIVQRAHQVATTDLPTLGSHGLPVVALPTDEVTLRLQPMDSDFSTTSLAPTEPLATVADAPTLRLPLPQGGEVTQRLAMSPDEVTQRLSPPLPPLFTQDLQPTVRITPPAPAPASAPAAPVTTGLEDDAEMREIFLEEAREVLDTAGHSLHTLRERHDDTAAMTTVRRAFHTLKGSARMVGLRDFGEAAWACEQLFNARLAEHAGANADLLAFSDEACGYFAGWVEAVAAGDVSAFHPGHLVDAAERLRTGPRAESSPTTPGVFHPSPVELPVAAADLVLAPVEPAPADAPLADAAADADVPTTTLTQRVPELPSAADLDLSSWGELDAPAPAVADELQPQELLPELLDTAAPPTAEAVELTLPDFDLAALEDSAASPAAPLPVGDSAELLEATTPLPVAEVSESADIDLLLETALADAAADGDAPAGPDGALAADIDLDLPDEPLDLTLPEAPALEAAPVPAPAEPVVALQPPAEAANDAVAEAEAYKQIGPLRISIPLFNIYLNEADELSRRLGTALAEWALELHRPVGEATVALAHSLAGNSATVGYAELSGLARHLEHALERTQARQRGTVDEAALYNRAADEIRRLLHLFAAGFLNPCDPALLQALHDIAHAAPDAERADDGGDSAPLPLPMALGQAALLPLGELAAASPLGAAARDGLPQFDDEIDAQDAVDAELFPIFDDEAQELLLQLQARLRDWSHRPADAAAASACMRSLHTFKGGARLAGAMRLGELAHRLESAVEHLAAQPGGATASAIEQLLGRVDTLQTQLEVLRHPPQADEAAQPTLLATPPALPAAPAEAAATAVPAPVAATEAAIAPPLPAVSSPVLPAAGPAPAVLPEIDWQRFGAAPVASAAEQAATPAHAAAASGVVRVRAPLLDRLVNQAGEVSITRARIDADVHQMKSALGDLTDNLERLRSQLRDIELQAETQITTRMEAARASSQGFDPLEMDRFTRFQELTRMMAESVADVATVQRGLQRTVQSAEDALAHQSRMTRDMQDDLLRTRMVEFDGLSERLYRVVRQAAKETAKPVRLDIIGGAIEIDRGVLDRMTPAFEHLLRNSVVHGIEPAAQRAAAGKDATGSITVAVNQVGNEVAVEVRDDGAGLDLPRIRERALATGLLAPDAQPSDGELANLVFQPGFSTAAEVTDLAGRGVGMDVVRTEVNAMGGRIETASAPGLGASFRLVLPLTTAVTQVVMLRCGDRAVAVPATLVEIVRRAPADELTPAYAQGRFRHGEHEVPFFWLDALLQGSARGAVAGRSAPVVIIRSAAQRIALHVDEVLGNQEVVIKNLGPQLSRLPGLVGMTLLPSGAPALIYNPVALATLYGEAAHAATQLAVAEAARAALPDAPPRATPLAPLVLVVDDSLTVRRVTQRLLQREGYRVTVAKDGLDGLEKLAGELPAVVLTDIEMPRMDGFDLVRNMKTDARLAALPLVMITSRIAQKHRDYAAELGVNHYLGKPYDEEELLRLVARYARTAGVS